MKRGLAVAHLPRVERESDGALEILDSSNAAYLRMTMGHTLSGVKSSCHTTDRKGVSGYTLDPSHLDSFAAKVHSEGNMRVKTIKLNKFKRFTDTTIDEIPETARLVVVTGPNGSGKSAIFEGMNLYRRLRHFGYNDDPTYFGKVGLADSQIHEKVSIEFHDPTVDQNPERIKKAVWVRSAFRHQVDVDVASINRMQSPLMDPGLGRLIETEGYVSSNYSRVASSTLDVFFDRNNRDLSAGHLVDGLIAPLQSAVSNVFEDLELDSLTAPMDQASFFFSKGQSRSFHYKNLSAGERAAFDLLLDMFVRTQTFDDTVFCIDEPEVHLGSRVQAHLLEELLKLVPDSCQLWVATHSPGMMRAAMKLYQDNPGQVVFLDTYDRDFDQPQTLKPVKPSSSFWKRSLEVALDDIADLIAPDELVLCEGSSTDGFDAKCYREIFANERASVEFISVGNSHEVRGDSQGIANAIQVVAPGTRVIRVVDRDDHTPDEINALKSEGVRVLSARNIEGYLLTDEVLEKLCEKYGMGEKAAPAVSYRDTRLEASVERGNPSDDFKKVAGEMKVYLSRELGITQPGSTPSAFLAEKVAPIITANMQTYRDLERDIFGA